MKKPAYKAAGMCQNPSMESGLASLGDNRQQMPDGAASSEFLVTLGWREWVGLPGLGIERIKAKVDTGARTSALHAFEVEELRNGDGHRVRFKIHPLQRDNETVIECIADIVDRRVVTDSGGHKEARWVIRSDVVVGPHTWPAEFTLTSRDDMMFRVLLGRTAIAGKAIVDPARSYLAGKRPGRASKEKS